VLDRRAMIRLNPVKRAARALRLLACVLTMTLAAGCGDACLNLASQICGCLPDDGTRGACNARAQSQEANFPVRSQDQSFCQKQIDSKACDCSKLGTPEGKLGCGLSYSPAAAAPAADQR
jgi:hypothetical protein